MDEWNNLLGGHWLRKGFGVGKHEEGEAVQSQERKRAERCVALMHLSSIGESSQYFKIAVFKHPLANNYA